jgi:hypothetical protein
MTSGSNGNDRAPQCSSGWLEMSLKVRAARRRPDPAGSVAHGVAQRLPGNLDADDWQIVMAVMEAVRTALPDANQRSPSSVLEFVLNAIRQADAKLIESAAE